VTATTRVITENDFEGCRKLLDSNFVDSSWEFLTKTKEPFECTIYRKPKEVTQLFCNHLIMFAGDFTLSVFQSWKIQRI
jgi:hypothetical protein